MGVSELWYELFPVVKKKILATEQQFNYLYSHTNLLHHQEQSLAEFVTNTTTIHSKIPIKKASQILDL
jgi:hypothetical protein